MALQEQPSTFLYFANTILDDERNLDDLIEADTYLHFEDNPPPTEKRSFVQSVINRLDWYRTGSGGTMFHGCKDPSVITEIATTKDSATSQITAGGNLIFSRESSLPGLMRRGSLDLPHLEQVGRKRSLESTASESEDFMMDPQTHRRRRCSE